MDDYGQQGEGRNDGAASDVTTPSRRALFRLGAVGAAAIVTIRPAVAQAATSVLTCQIPVPDPGRAGQYIAADGSTVPAGTAGAFAPPGAPLKGQDVKAALSGATYPGKDAASSQAYTNYIRRLQHGQSGFTCYASLQMPGR
jgi:hypothetical protein